MTWICEEILDSTYLSFLLFVRNINWTLLSQVRCLEYNSHNYEVIHEDRGTEYGLVFQFFVRLSIYIYISGTSMKEISNLNSKSITLLQRWRHAHGLFGGAIFSEKRSHDCLEFIDFIKTLVSLNLSLVCWVFPFWW